MNEKQRNGDRGVKVAEKRDQAGPSKIMTNIYIKEELIIPDEDPVEEEYNCGDIQHPAEEFQGDDEGHALVPPKEDFGEPDPGTDLNVLYEAWRNYNRSLKEKKKKKKNRVLEIYRDENYWTEDRFTDEEDFNYPEC